MLHGMKNFVLCGEIGISRHRNLFPFTQVVGDTMSDFLLNIA